MILVSFVWEMKTTNTTDLLLHLFFASNHKHLTPCYAFFYSFYLTLHSCCWSDAGYCVLKLVLMKDEWMDQRGVGRMYFKIMLSLSSFSLASRGDSSLCSVSCFPTLFESFFLNLKIRGNSKLLLYCDIPSPFCPFFWLRDWLLLMREDCSGMDPIEGGVSGLASSSSVLTMR